MSKDGKKREADRVRRQARKLARKLGCDIEIERRGPFEFGGEFSMLYWVWPPEWVYDTPADEQLRDDPLEGDHTACDWHEVTHCLRVYQRDMYLAGLGLTTKFTLALVALDRGDLVRQAAEECCLLPLQILADQIEEAGGRDDVVATLREAISRAS